MKIIEARQLYHAQITAYREQQAALSKQKKELEEKSSYANEAAILELTMRAVEEKQAEYMDYMGKLNAQWSATANMVSAKQQGEAMEEYVADLGKIMEVARRLMKGGIVPPSDEKKLMEYSMEMYQMAKNMGSMEKQREKEEYDSLWDEKQEEKVYEDPIETADNTEAFAKGPEIVDVAEITVEQS